MPITGLQDIVLEYASAVAQAAAEAYLDDATDAAPEKTGATKLSRYGPTLSFVGAGIMRAVVGFSDPAAEYTDQGTVPHVIRPRTASALRFFWDSGPQGAGWYSFDHVNHPGVTGTHWFSDFEANWEDYVQSAADQGGAAWAPPINSLTS